MRRAQNRHSQFPQRYCLIDTNRNNLSRKSWRRDRLIRLLLQFGHVITRKRLYSLIERSKYSILVYRLRLQNRCPHFPQRYGLINANFSNLSMKFRRCERAIKLLLHLGHEIIGNNADCNIRKFDSLRTMPIAVLEMCRCSRFSPAEIFPNQPRRS